MAICFEVSINGLPPLIAGSEQAAVLSAILSYVARPAGQLDIDVGALVTRQNDDKEHWSWLRQGLKLGDEIVIRVTENQPAEPTERVAQSPGFAEEKERAYYERLRLKYEGW